MEIALLSDMVKELILDNDEVSLPGLGAFVAEVVPSSFSDKGYTVNPPYRRLSFREKNLTDKKLAEMYSRENGIDMGTAQKIVMDFASGLKEELRKKKVVVFPGLGRLRATRENAFFFIPDEDLDIYPYGIGLGPVSLKTHEETKEEVRSAVEDLAAIVEEPGSIAVERVDGEEKGEAVIESHSREREVPAYEVPETVDVKGAENPGPETSSAASAVTEVIAGPEDLAPEDVAPMVQAEGPMVEGVRTMSDIHPMPEASPGPETLPEPELLPKPGIELKLETMPKPESMTEPESMPGPEALPGQTEPDRIEIPATETTRGNGAKHRSPAFVAGVTAACVAGVAVTLLAAFLLLANLAPDFVDSILYTPEQLEILNAPYE